MLIFAKNLAFLRGNEVHGHHHAQFGVAQLEFGDQEGEQRRQHELEEMAAAMGQPDQPDRLDIAGAFQFLQRFHSRTLQVLHAA